MSSKHKVVIDTNIFIKGWFFDDPDCKTILNFIRNRKLYLGFTQDTIGELLYVTKNFARNKISDENERLELLNGIVKLFYYGSSVNTVGMSDIENIIDKTDLMFAHCAINYNADYLISNDFKSGMFNLDHSYPFQVVNAESFVHIMSSTSRP